MTLSDTVATLKLEAVARVAERLLRHASDETWGSTHVGMEALGSELRSIVEAEGPVPTGDPTETAMAELALWARCHAGAVPPDALEAALLSELVSLQLDHGRTLADLRRRCDVAWFSIRRLRSALERATVDDSRAASVLRDADGATD